MALKLLALDDASKKLKEIDVEAVIQSLADSRADIRIDTLVPDLIAAATTDFLDESGVESQINSHVPGLISTAITNADIPGQAASEINSLVPDMVETVKGNNYNANGTITINLNGSTERAYEVSGWLRIETTTSGSYAYVRFNGDTGTNYFYSIIKEVNGTVSGNDVDNVSYIALNTALPSGNNAFMYFKYTVYCNPLVKSGVRAYTYILGEIGVYDVTSVSHNRYSFFGAYKSTSAITSLTMGSGGSPSAYQMGVKVSKMNNPPAEYS